MTSLILLTVSTVVVLLILAVALFKAGQPPAPDEVDIEEWLNQHRIDDSDETKGA